MVQPTPAPPSITADKSNKMKAGGNSQKLILFMRGKAISGAPIIIGTNQLPKPPMRPAPSIKTTGMTPEMKRKLKEALKKTAKTAAKAAKKATKKMGTKTPAKKRKQKYNQYGPGTMNTTKDSYETGP